MAATCGNDSAAAGRKQLQIFLHLVPFLYHCRRLALSSGVRRILGKDQNGQRTVGAGMHRLLTGAVETFHFTGDCCRSVVTLVLGL